MNVQVKETGMRLFGLGISVAPKQWRQHPLKWGIVGRVTGGKVASLNTHAEMKTILSQHGFYCADDSREFRY